MKKIQMTVLRDGLYIDMEKNYQLGIVTYDASGALPVHVRENYFGEEGNIVLPVYR